MADRLLSLILKIREEIRKEKSAYLNAIESGRTVEAREIAERITRLKNELEKLQPNRKGYHGL